MTEQATVRLKCTFDYIPHDKGSKWCSLKIESIVDESHMHRYKTCSVYYDEISIASIENGGTKTNYNIYERFNTIF